MRAFAATRTILASFSGFMLTCRIMPLCRSLIFMSLIASICWSQVDTGTIAGVVKDPSGAVVAGASIVIRNVGTGAGHKVSTNSIGEYVSGPLTPGAQSPGFRETVGKLTLTLNQRAVLDLALEGRPESHGELGLALRSLSRFSLDRSV